MPVPFACQAMKRDASVVRPGGNHLLVGAVGVGGAQLKFADVGIIVAHESEALAVGGERGVGIDVVSDELRSAAENRRAVEIAIGSYGGFGLDEIDVVSVREKNRDRCRWRRRAR